ncbi:hypothetical protein SODALDRAFT_363004 [Sodiomyces alkalinus F11]|uniref:Uncharacterized protein n=1 Tax=Sodiomyces alkalinus (strain CBS 110278 / VKM F-3762 / F11) TaxID=1314773 RepID=A0A3N2PNN3_SODAK|nr:hypothetical protein SODALDRAFT_363004 [Sodiomyces alkalinus F11]ROT36141.1 hypothetical protein SODALDRAFT_363004 [Sodiomyces alkalinus F11]
MEDEVCTWAYQFGPNRQFTTHPHHPQLDRGDTVGGRDRPSRQMFYVRTTSPLRLLHLVWTLDMFSCCPAARLGTSKLTDRHNTDHAVTILLWTVVECGLGSLGIIAGSLPMLRAFFKHLCDDDSTKDHNNSANTDLVTIGHMKARHIRQPYDSILQVTVGDGDGNDNDNDSQSHVVAGDDIGESTVKHRGHKMQSLIYGRACILGVGWPGWVDFWGWTYVCERLVRLASDHVGNGTGRIRVPTR